jgi:hypothetical protein
LALVRSRSAILATLLLLGGAPLVATIGLSPRGAAAATAIELGMSDLVSGSTLVMAGTALEARSNWEGDASTHGRRIVTYTRVRVDRLLDGPARSEVWIRTLGGEVGDIGQQVAGEAVLRPSEPTLLFLRDRIDGTYAVVGMAQGQYLLETRPENGVVRVRAPREGGHLFAKAIVSGSAGPSARQALVGHSLDEVAELVAAERRAHVR